MCYQCHSKLSDENVNKTLKSALENPEFEKWNNTSISHLCITSLGFNGEEARLLSNQLFEEYITWKQSNFNKMDGSLFGNPTSRFVMKAYDHINTIYIQRGEKNGKELVHYWMGEVSDFDNYYRTIDSNTRSTECIML